MTNIPVIHRDAKACKLKVWIPFGIAMPLCGVGLAWLPGQQLDRAFIVMGYTFCLSTAFFLAKFVRDNQHKSVETSCGAWWCGWRFCGHNIHRMGLMADDDKRHVQGYLVGQLVVSDNAHINSRQNPARQA